MNGKGLMGGFYVIAEWISRISITNLLWNVLAAPFMFAILFPLFVLNVGIDPNAGNTMSLLTTGGLIAAVLAPFLFFPATAAMFACARKWVLGEEDVPIFKTFFKAYKQNYLQSMIAGLFYVVILVVLIIDYVYFTKMTSKYEFLGYFFIVGISIVVMAMLYFFSYVVHLRLSTFQIIKNSFLLIAARPFRSLFFSLLSAVIVYISLSSAQLMFLMIFFSGSIVALISYWNFNMIYIKMTQDEQNKSS